MNSKVPQNRKRKERNSTIKEQEELINQNGLQNDSSIALHEDTDVHYYDLDYSDQGMNEGIVSSSDQEQRQISHEEFLHMITSNEVKNLPSFKEDLSADQEEEYRNQNKPKNRYTKSHDFKKLHNKKYTPDTRDRSQNVYEYGMKNVQKHSRNDPQKSSEVKNKLHFSKETSFNVENSVRQFRIDSFLNAHVQQKQQKKPRKKSGAQSKINQTKIKDQDSQFSLITLPEYDQENHSFIASKQNIQSQQKTNQKKKRLGKYKDVAKLTSPSDNEYDKLNWRYQQAKLKFMDNFLPDSLKIGSSSYNMLKYMNRKSELTFNMLMM